MNGWSLAWSSALAFAAALAFYPARGQSGRSQTLAWLVSSTVVALSPCLVPLTSTSLRLLATLIAIALLVKLYDMHREPQAALRLTLRSYLAFLVNGFWHVLRRVPSRVPPARDLRLLARRSLASLACLLVCGVLWLQDWSTVPFAWEHVLKAAAYVLAVVSTTNAAASAWRLLGGLALDPMGNIVAARTPADFWRRWNRPAQQFLNEYVFLPAGGPRRALRAALFTFSVSGLVHEYVFGIAAGRIQGCQLLFFMIQGCAVVATRRVRPSGAAVPLWIAGTLAFNLVSSVLFFRSVDAVLPFYGSRSP